MKMMKSVLKLNTIKTHYLNEHQKSFNYLKPCQTPTYHRKSV